VNRLRFQLPLFVIIRTVFNTAFRMVYPFLPVLARGLGVDIQAMSLGMTARAVVGGLGPFAASLADSRGRKFGMLFGLSFFTLGTAIVVFWPTFPVFVISLVLTTLGKYGFDPSMQAFLGDRIPYERRGRALAITEVGWSAAFIVGVPLMGFLIARGGWMAPFPLLTLLALLSMIGLFVLVPADRNDPQEAANLFNNFRAVLIYLPALAGLAVGFLATTANELVNFIFGVWLEDSFGLQITALGAASAVIGLSEFGGEGLVAIFVDKLGKPRAVGLGFLANSLAALLLPWLGRSTPGALVGLFLFYITFEFTLVSIIPMMTEVMPQRRATLMAFNIAALSFGRALGAPLAPLLYRSGFFAVILGVVTFNILALLALRYLQKELK